MWKKAEEPRKEKIEVRCTESEKEQIQKIAAQAGYPVGEHVRRSALNRRGVDHSNEAMIRMLREICGQQKELIEELRGRSNAPSKYVEARANEVLEQTLEGLREFVNMISVPTKKH